VTNLFSFCPDFSLAGRS